MHNRPQDADEIQVLRHRVDELEAQHEAMQQRYLSLFEHVGDSIFIVDPNTNLIMDLNENAARRLGYRKDELRGKAMTEVEYPDPDQDMADSKAWKSIMTGTLVYECMHRHKDGSFSPVEVSSRLTRQGGQELLYSFARSIAHRRRIEAEREQLIADLDGFARTVAHDLKNPLGTIMTFADLLGELWPTLSDSEIREHLASLYDTSRRAVGIVEALLLFARAESVARVAVKPLDMAAIFDEVRQRFSRQLMETGAQLQVPTSWPTALGYAPWVAEIWANYLSNALKYGGQPPQITVGAAVQPDDLLRFWMHDEGPGIPPDQVPGLFNHFTRLSDLRVEGHGLGLSIAKRIAEKLGGGVGVETALEQGSTFYFTLPAH